ncbi:MAG: hypothetical protein GTN53_27745 [Candidatus Aminicenantes bacterium]|nr:hypothetical protein [Gammaproteobacteria bacterium]NIO84312.1 hypothetical protein [Candidatus Aminicenantes bacterium]NIQ70278.1 hypothetical protein [Candidatus Aminicenantes bacterium]NIT26309.1 hypothetical protein [Candidatus Aminicenantes bacterium]
MKRKVLRLVMSVFLSVLFIGSASAQCKISLTTDKDVYKYGEDVTATLYSDTCHFVMMYYYVFDSDGNIIKRLDPHLVSHWPQQVDYYWDQTDSSGRQVSPGTYEIADPKHVRSVTVTILGVGRLYALSLRPTSYPAPNSWKIAELVEIDLCTCASTKIGVTGAGLDQSQWSLDLSFDSLGNLWAVNGVSTWNNLVTIDTDTGAGTVMGSTGLLMEGIAFDADGILYAADSGLNNWDNNGDRLVQVDTTDFTYADVGTTYYDIDGLAFAPDGTLYGVDSGWLLEVDKASGTVSPIGYLGYGGFYAITFGPDGIMYGALSNGDIYIIDPETAAPYYVCSTGFPYMVGLAFAPLTPSDIDDYIQGLPEGCFKNNADQRKNALYNKLMEVQDLIDAGDYQEAIDKLTHDIKPKMDGEGNNDWITCTGAQDYLIILINTLIEYLEGLL